LLVPRIGLILRVGHLDRSRHRSRLPRGCRSAWRSRRSAGCGHGSHADPGRRL